MIMMQKIVEANRTTTKVKIFCDRIDLAADVIQDMATYFKWADLDSEADFPTEFTAFEEVVYKLSILMRLYQILSYYNSGG